MKKKIVFLATYVGEVNRGAETFVIELVKVLKANFDIEVYSLGYNSDIKDQIIKVEYKIPLWFKFHKWLYDIFYPYRYICFMKNLWTPDALHQKFFNEHVYKKYLKDRDDIALMFPNNGVYGAKVSKLIREKYNTPFIYTGHGGIGFSEELIIRERPDLYISLTEAHKKWASKFTSDVVKIPNGVDTEKFINSTKKELNQIKTVICVGALVALKRQKLLIDAINLLPNVKLLLLGDGELKEELLLYGDKHLGGRFKIKSVKYDEIFLDYQMADVFSLPTKVEPFGIVYLEAMACNLPVVAPDDGPRREIIGEAGFFCDVENAIDYAKAIDKALAVNWADLPRKRAVDNFDWRTTGARYANEIEKIIRG